ncbi:MAG: hypothetical protein ACKO7B_05465 [Flavobacteriales bacterium]
MSSTTKLHHYTTAIRWTGNGEEGKSDYGAYERSHEISLDGKIIIQGSSDAAFFAHIGVCFFLT